MEQYDEFKNFRRYRQVADELIAHSMPEELAECAKLLALNVAHYQSKYGALPIDELLASLDADALGQDQIKLMSEGMQMLVGILGFVRSTDDPSKLH
jgi:hypothetical protein